jgi:hypothetical protein
MPTSDMRAFTADDSSCALWVVVGGADDATSLGCDTSVDGSPSELEGGALSTVVVVVVSEPPQSANSFSEKSIGEMPMASAPAYRWRNYK